MTKLDASENKSWTWIRIFGRFLMNWPPLDQQVMYSHFSAVFRCLMTSHRGKSCESFTCLPIDTCGPPCPRPENRWPAVGFSHVNCRGGFIPAARGETTPPEITKMLHRLYSGEVRFEKLSIELLRKGACSGLLEGWQVWQVKTGLLGACLQLFILFQVMKKQNPL